MPRVLSGHDRKFLRAQAHSLDPVVIVGKQGLTEAGISAIGRALDTHELIKVRFNDFKDQKRELSAQIAEQTQSDLCGLIGHVAIFYREHPEPEKRKVNLP